MVLDFNPNSPANRFREKRFAWFLDLLTQVNRRNGALRILDVGGTMPYWTARLSRLDGLDLQVTLLNKAEMPVGNDPRFRSVTGDARDLSQSADDSFDVVHSNSVIEHVGRWVDMAAMAREVRRSRRHISSRRRISGFRSSRTAGRRSSTGCPNCGGCAWSCRDRWGSAKGSGS